MREITQRALQQANKYITPRWHEKYGFLQPYEIDEEKMAETTNGIYLKCICHFPNCPTMAGIIDPQHPYARVRASKLNGRTQISCGACAKKARQVQEYKFEEMKAGDTIGCWHLDEELKNKDLKNKMGWSGNSKYYKAHCIYCGITDFKNSDHLKVGDSSCVCRSGTFNEKRINSLLKRIFTNNTKYSYMSEYSLDNQRIDFAILNNENEPVFFIEYDGEFHDKAEMAKGELNQAKERDLRKNTLAKKLNIPLVRVTYKEQNKITKDWLKQQIITNIGNIFQNTKEQ